MTQRMAVIGVILLALCIVIGALDVLRWVVPHLVVGETSPYRRFQVAARRPLLELGAAAAIAAGISIALVVSGRLPDPARLGVLGVGLLASATLIGVGHARYDSLRHPTASLKVSLQQVRVPPSWKFEGWFGPRGPGAVPATWGVWTSAGETTDAACQEADAAVARWKGTTGVTKGRTPLLGVACTISGMRSDGKVFARVSGSLDDLAAFAFIGQAAAFPRGATGPAIAIQLLAKT